MAVSRRRDSHSAAPPPTHTLPLAGVSMWMWRGRQRNGTVRPRGPADRSNSALTRAQISAARADLASLAPDSPSRNHRRTAAMLRARPRSHGDTAGAAWGGMTRGGELTAGWSPGRVRRCVRPARRQAAAPRGHRSRVCPASAAATRPNRPTAAAQDPAGPADAAAARPAARTHTHGGVSTHMFECYEPAGIALSYSRLRAACVAGRSARGWSERGRQRADVGAHRFQ